MKRENGNSGMSGEADELMTGAEMVVRALVDQGVEDVFGYPGGAVLPIYDALFQQDRAAPHPGAPRAGRDPRGRGLCPLDRQARRGAGHLRPRRDQRRHRPHRRADGLDPDRRASPARSPTHLIGNDAFQEGDTIGITRPCTKHNYLVKDVDDLPRDHPRGVPHRDAPAGPGPVRDRHPQGRPVRQAAPTSARPRSCAAQELPAADQGRPGRDRRRRSS